MSTQKHHVSVKENKDKTYRTQKQLTQEAGVTAQRLQVWRLQGENPTTNQETRRAPNCVISLSK